MALPDDSALGPGKDPDLAGPEEIVFGTGQFSRVGILAARLGRRALAVTGSTRRHVEQLQALLRAEQVMLEVHSFRGEPTVATVLEGLGVAHRFHADLVIGIGGGSAIDAAKAIAGLLANAGDPTDYLEVVGHSRALEFPAMPWIAVPTTAGTGAEVTRNAVLGVPEQRLKVSLRSPHLFARKVLVDPELTYDSPAALTAACGMDALTQLIEPYVCNRPSRATDALCARGIPQAARALQRLVGVPGDKQARNDLALAALWSGQALSNAGLGAVHGLAGPVGGMFPAPHGAVCALLLAPVMQKNFAVLRLQCPSHPALARYDDVARWLTGNPAATAEDGWGSIANLVRRMKIPPLAGFGVTVEDIPGIAARAANASSMKANPVALSEGDLREIMTKALY